jgi:hypothetical protein
LPARDVGAFRGHRAAHGGHDRQWRADTWGANTFDSLTLSAGTTIAISAFNNATTAGPLGDGSPCTIGGTLEYTGGTATSTKTLVMATGGKATVSFAGIPGYRYDVERAEDADFTVNLSNVWTTNAPAGGLFIFVDDNPPGSQAYCRLKYNP